MDLMTIGLGLVTAMFGAMIKFVIDDARGKQNERKRQLAERQKKERQTQNLEVWLKAMEEINREEAEERNWKPWNPMT